MERINSEGIPRSNLVAALNKRSTVGLARHINTCLLCRSKGVNEAGICDVCYATILDPEEHRLISRWLSGEGP